MNIENEKVMNNEEPEKELQLEKLAEKQFNVWNDMLQSKDPEKVASLYSEKNSFLPTFSPDFKKDKNGAMEYFKHFLEKDPNGEIVDEMIQETSVDKNGEVDGFLHSGFYNFTVGKPDDRQISEARFTFFWKKDENGNWKILHHHSSAKPQG